MPATALPVLRRWRVRWLPLPSLLPSWLRALLPVLLPVLMPGLLPALLLALLSGSLLATTAAQAGTGELRRSATTGAGNPQRAPLDLTGYLDWTGALTVLHEGQFIDPYLALQALLQAHAHGLETSAAAERFGRWLLVRQKADASFDRFCRTGPVWLGCKTADANASVLGMWLQLIALLPPAVREEPEWEASRRRTAAALAALRDPARGIYPVSASMKESLLIDNIDAWSALAAGSLDAPDTRQPAAGREPAARVAGAILQSFWDPATRRFQVSTREQSSPRKQAFHPDEVAQVYPLLFDFPLPAGIDRAAWYRSWMRRQRANWLTRTKTDFAWGLLALLALRQGDAASARCWLREALPYRHSRHWTVVDEVASQVLASRRIEAAPAGQACD